MNPEDDPEARIRELERPIADLAQASELGTRPQTGGGAYLPPPVPGYNAPDYGTPVYGAPQPYGSPAYGLPPGTPYGARPRKVSAGIPWMVFGLIAVVFLARRGAIVFSTRMPGLTVTAEEIGTPGDTRAERGRAQHSGAPGVISRRPVNRSASPASTRTRRSPATTATVNISGIRNTVNITGALREGECVRYQKHRDGRHR